MATSVWSAGTRKGLMFRGILVLSLALVVSAATSAMAREVRAPFDTGGCVQTMTRAMAEEFHLLLAEHPTLAEARLFRVGAAMLVAPSPESRPGWLWGTGSSRVPS